MFSIHIQKQREMNSLEERKVNFRYYSLVVQKLHGIILIPNFSVQYINKVILDFSF